jgi:hypothetical protein
MIEEVSLGAKLIGFFKGIPTWLYALIAVAGLIGLGVHLHSNAVHKAIAAAEKRGEEREAQHVLAAVQKITKKANDITAAIRSKSDETNRHIIADAGDLRLRGPGKAVCPGSAAPAASEHSAPGRPVDVGMASVPNPGGPVLIALPFNDTIRFAEQCDLNRAEALSWREQHDKLQAAQPAIPTLQEQPK